jgi:ankyrin repeat protein
MPKQLPPRPSLEHLKREARDLRRAHRARDAEALQLIRDHHPKLSGRPSIEQVAAVSFSIQDAQLVLARAYQFNSWPDLVAKIAWTPARQSLAAAISDNNVSEVERILDEYPELMDIHVRSENEGPPLSHAANQGKPDVVRALLSRGPSDLEHAFGRATLQGHLDVAQRLLDYQPALRQQLKFALFGPCEALNAEAIPFLIELGADPDAVWENGGKPLDMALCSYERGGREATVRALVEGGVTYEDGPEMDLAMGKFDSLTSRLDSDPSLVHRASTFRAGLEFGGLYGGAPLIGHTLLHLCAEYSSLEGARLLLERRADVNARCQPDAHGIGDQTPLFHAVNHKHEDLFPVLSLLLQNGADVNARATIRVPRAGIRSAQPDDPVLEGVTPLGYALHYPNSLYHKAHAGAIELLREHGAEE